MLSSKSAKKAEILSYIAAVGGDITIHLLPVMFILYAYTREQLKTHFRSIIEI